MNKETAEDTQRRNEAINAIYQIANRVESLKKRGAEPQDVVLQAAFEELNNLEQFPC